MQERPESAMTPHSRKRTFIAVTTFSLLTVPSCSRSGNTSVKSAKTPNHGAVDTPPAGIPGLSTVLIAVERGGYAPIVEVEFEKDHWEIKAYRDGQLLQFKTDLRRGEIIPDPPPQLERPLSAIVADLEKQGYGPILDIEKSSGDGEHTIWEAEAYKEGSKIGVSVDGASGKVIPK